MSYNALIRDLKNGKEYNALFPTPKGKKLSLGKGDTHTSIKLIIDWALQYNHEVKLVATKLQQGSLSETCFSIHDFLFNHFQYKADGEAQLLRSPARAWQDRYDGIDCKSYSIIASCILLQLGIKHYIRKIKQSAFAPESFTHVYVIVPVNQTSGSLANGYYTIDGTLRSTQEPHHIDKKDFFMDKLKHYGLNGLRSTADSPDNPWNYSGNPESETNTTVINNTDWSGFFKDLKFDKIFASIACWGGTAFDANILQGLIPEIQKYFFGIINEYNTAIAEKRFSDIHKIVVKFAQRKQTLLKVYHVKFESKDWNGCSDESFYFVFDFLNNKIGDILFKSLKAHAETYFQIGTDRNYSISFTQPANTQDTFEGVPMWGTFNSVPVSEMTVRSWDANPKPFTYSVNVTPKQEVIPAFVLTEQIKAALNSDVANTQLNLSDVLQTIATTAPILFPLIHGTGSIDENGQNIYDENNPKTTSNAGSYLLGGLAILGLLTWGFSKMKDTGKGSTTAKKPAK